jgi:hypothetical protein
MGAAKGSNKNAIPLRGLAMAFGLKHLINRFSEQFYVNSS